MPMYSVFYYVRGVPTRRRLRRVWASTYNDLLSQRHPLRQEAVDHANSTMNAGAPVKIQLEDIPSIRVYDGNTLALNFTFDRQNF